MADLQSNSHSITSLLDKENYPLKQSEFKYVTEGSRLVIRYAKNTCVVVDHPGNVLISSHPIEEDQKSYNRIALSHKKEDAQLSVIDAGPSFVYFPISLKRYPVIYTGCNASHVTYGDIRRVKIRSRNLPYKICNKFTAITNDATNVSTKNTNSNSDNLNESQNLGDALEDAKMVFLRGNSSLFCVELKNCEKMMLNGAYVAAWTNGLIFQYRRIFCCFSAVEYIQGNPTGAFWIYNPLVK